MPHLQLLPGTLPSPELLDWLECRMEWNESPRALQPQLSFWRSSHPSSSSCLQNHGYHLDSLLQIQPQLLRYSRILSGRRGRQRPRSSPNPGQGGRLRVELSTSPTLGKQVLGRGLAPFLPTCTSLWPQEWPSWPCQLACAPVGKDEDKHCWLSTFLTPFHKSLPLRNNSFW